MELSLEETNPTISLTNDELKDIADWEVDETYAVKLVLKQTQKSERKKEEGGTHVFADFEVIDAKGEPLTDAAFDNDPYGG